MLRIPSQLIKLASREEDWEIFLGSSDDYNIQAGMRTIDFDSDQPDTKQCLEISRDWFLCSKRLHAPVPLHMLFSPLECSSLSLLSTWKKKNYPSTSSADVIFRWSLSWFSQKDLCQHLKGVRHMFKRSLNVTALLSRGSRRESPRLQQPSVYPSWENSKNVLVPFAPDKEIQLPVIRIALPNTKTL